MTEKNRDNRAIVRGAGSICAAWLVAAAGASQAIAQQGRDPFNQASAPDSEVTVSEYMTVDLHVQDEDLVNVLQMLSLQSERNIVVSDDVSRTVSANLYNVTFFEALDAILHVNGYGYIEKGNFIFVYTLEEIAEIEQAERTPESRIVRLNYLNANDAAEFVAPLLSEVGQIKTNAEVEEYTIPDDTPTGNESFAMASTLVLYDYAENLDEIEELLHQLDTRPAQVLVEATILEASLTEENAFGIDFSIISDVQFTDFIDAGGPLSVANALQKGGDSGITPADNQGTGFASTPGNTAGPSTFKMGIVEEDFSIFMRVLDQITDVTVLSNPKVLTLNRQPARVLVGDRIGFLNTTSTETSTTQTVEFLDTGTKLSFRPFISTDGMIRLELSPSVSTATIRQATDVTGSTVSIPDERTQELTTNVLVRDGSTIVLGGLFKESTTLGRKQVPIVGDIPIIGAAFRGHDDKTVRAEIIFMVRPTIMNDEMLIEDGMEATEEVRRARAGARSGLLPWSRDRVTALMNVEAERLAHEGDTEKALWKIRRSLELNPIQPEAIHLREQLLNEREVWPNRSILDRVVDEEYTERLSAIQPIEYTPNLKLTVSETREMTDAEVDLVSERMDRPNAAKATQWSELANVSEDVEMDLQSSVGEGYDGPAFIDPFAFPEGFGPVDPFMNPEFMEAEASTEDGDFGPQVNQLPTTNESPAGPWQQQPAALNDLELSMTITPAMPTDQQTEQFENAKNEAPSDIFFDDFESAKQEIAQQPADQDEFIMLPPIDGDDEIADADEEFMNDPFSEFEPHSNAGEFDGQQAYPLTGPLWMGNPAMMVMQAPVEEGPVSEEDESFSEDEEPQFTGFWKVLAGDLDEEDAEESDEEESELTSVDEDDDDSPE